MRCPSLLLVLAALLVALTQAVKTPEGTVLSSDVKPMPEGTDSSRLPEPSTKPAAKLQGTRQLYQCCTNDCYYFCSSGYCCINAYADLRCCY